MEHRILAGQIGVVLVGVGKGDLHVEGLAGGVADDLGQEVVNVGVASGGNQSAVAVGVAAAELLAVHTAHVVNVHHVAVFDGAVLDLVVGGVLIQNGVDLGVQLIVGDGVLLGGHGDALVLGQGHQSGAVHTLQGAIVVQVSTVHIAVVLHGRRAAGSSLAGRAGSAAACQAERQGQAGADAAQTDQILIQCSFPP